MRVQSFWNIVRTPFAEMWLFIHKDSNYDSQAIGVIISSILAIGTIYLAWIANQTAKNAEQISKLALESERPKIQMSMRNNSILLSNTGNFDAINITVLIKLADEKIKTLYDNLAISSGVESYELPIRDFEDKNCKASVIIIYTNSVLQNQNYLLAYNVNEGDSSLTQLNDNDSLFKYSDYLSVYKIANTLSYFNLVNYFLIK